VGKAGYRVLRRQREAISRQKMNLDSRSKNMSVVRESLAG